MPARSFSLPRVAFLLSLSGACALIYQVAWFRELRLIFGASTAASAAVLAVFMAGLGIGGALLGKRADRSPNPLAFYAQLEAGVAVTAAISPGLVYVAQLAYLGIGGAASLGNVGATVARLFLTALAIGPSALLMGGTLPAAARAVERASDRGRQRLAVLYGVNTLGAVVGTLAANFLLVEVFGNRLTLWLACLLNGLVAMFARVFSRSGTRISDTTDSTANRSESSATAANASSDADTAMSPGVRWFPPFAAGMVGIAFMLMELVWYRMLAPLLGGSSYTFGLILALALAGIGLGGLLYARTKRPATMSLFALTCALEALALAVPFALGDRLAILALLLRPLAQTSFAGAIASWTLVASIVVVPAAIVSGYQFPVVFGLYGRGSRDVAKHVGHAYLANTVGSIVGSVSGGFGLLPLLSAPRCWQLVAGLLLATALLAAVLDVRSRRRLSLAGLGSVATAVPAALLLFATGPTATWRHSGIGAGRADLLGEISRQRLEEFAAEPQAELAWEADGLESSIALMHQSGYIFFVNGKSDGSILGDAGTQVMGGLLPALLHGDVKRALVVGLGTGSTAGWLGTLPSVERVDVVELEPAILRVARDCAPANQAALDNPKVKVTLGDAREVLRTTRERYDVIFSEPSNPYRAGISSLYTEEFYRAAATRLNETGLFVQWIQAYEIDPMVVATAATTLRQVFPSVSLWEPMRGDLLLVASRTRGPIDVDRMRELLKVDAFSDATRTAWKTASAEGVLARFLAGPKFVDTLVANDLGVVNTDDRNFLEFAFARNVGNRQRSVSDELHALAARLDLETPEVRGTFDTELIADEKLLAMIADRVNVTPGPSAPPARVAYARALAHLQTGDAAGGLKAWADLHRAPRGYHEGLLLASATARTGDERAESFVPSGVGAAERDLLRALWLARRGDRAQAIDALERGFLATRKDPWVERITISSALELAPQLAKNDPAVARRLASAVAEPFAVEIFRTARLESYVKLARAAADPKLCVTAIDSAGHLGTNRFLYESRMVCYQAAQDPRYPEAERAFGKFLLAKRPFGADLPSAPRARTAPPATAAVGEHDDSPDASFAPPAELGPDGGTGVQSTSP
jgi:spermidine synthase